MKFTRISDKEISTEARVIDQAKKNPRHFKVLYERYHGDIYRYIYHKVRSMELSDDLTAQVFTKALNKLKKYQHQGVPFSAWLFRIAINEVNQYFRQSKKTQFITVEAAGLDALQEEVEDKASQEAMLDMLRELLQTLPDEEVTLIDLRFFEGLPFQDIAAILGISEANAKARTYRLLKRMKKELEADHRYGQEI